MGTWMRMLAMGLVAVRLHPSLFEGQTVLSVNSSLVLVPASVTDGGNRPVTGLDRSAFQIRENRAAREVAAFSGEDQPVSLGIVFDRSGSMAGSEAAARESVARFLDVANPEDEFFLVEFSARPRLSAPWTGDARVLLDELARVRPQGRTALLDAVHLALDYVKSGHRPRRALLVISDGGDNLSRYTAAELRRMARESDTWIYSIALGSRSVFLPEQEAAGGGVLESLAAVTGGRGYTVHEPGDFSRIAVQIGEELRSQYLLGFRPAAGEDDGKYHRIRVALKHRPALRVAARPGYYAPAGPQK